MLKYVKYFIQFFKVYIIAFLCIINFLIFVLFIRNQTRDVRYRKNIGNTGNKNIPVIVGLFNLPVSIFVCIWQKTFILQSQKILHPTSLYFCIQLLLHN